MTDSAWVSPDCDPNEVGNDQRSREEDQAEQEEEEEAMAFPGGDPRRPERR